MNAKAPISFLQPQHTHALLLQFLFLSCQIYSAHIFRCFSPGNLSFIFFWSMPAARYTTSAFKFYFCCRATNVPVAVEVRCIRFSAFLLLIQLSLNTSFCYSIVIIVHWLSSPWKVGVRKLVIFLAVKYFFYLSQRLAAYYLSHLEKARQVRFLFFLILAVEFGLPIYVTWSYYFLYLLMSTVMNSSSNMQLCIILLY